MNDLLLWMSARGQGSIASFRASAAELLLPVKGRIARYRIAEWHLSQLAHAEFGAAAAGGWKIAPPVLAAGDPSQAPRAILCGARTLSAVGAVLSAAGALATVEVQREGPDIIAVTASAPGDMQAISRACAIPLQWNAPLAILGAAIRPDSMQLSAASVPVGGGWIVSRFSKSGLAWVESSVREAQQAAVGLFRFRSDHGSAAILKEAGVAYAIEPSQGKYRILSRRHRPLHYSAGTETLSAPIACRPPALIERALTVASGRLPEVRDGRVIYTCITTHVAQTAAELLAQRLN